MSTATLSAGKELRRRLENHFGSRLKGVWRIDEEPVPEKTGYDLHYAVVIEGYGRQEDRSEIAKVFTDFNYETAYDPGARLWALSEADYEEGWHDTARAIRREGRRIQ